MTEHPSQRLVDVSPELDRILTHNQITTPARFAVSDVRCETVKVAMRDGVKLATDFYLPPSTPAPVVVMRTPYNRALDGFAGHFLALVRRGYAVVSQDVRGTGDSEPDSWDYYVYEPEDGYDCIEWVIKQEWFGGFIGSFGGSYIGQTQWHMAMHPAMSTVVPQVSGLGIAVNTAHLYMFLNAYAHTVGKGQGKIEIPYYEMERHFEKETMAGGYFDEPLHKPFTEALHTRFPVLRELPPSQAKRWLWEQYCALSCTERAAFIKQALGVKNVASTDVESLSGIFGHRISHDAHTLPHPDPAELCRQIVAPPLLITGWYDWGVNDALATWELLQREARESLASRTRLIITPSSHNTLGYCEDIIRHPALQNGARYNVDLIMRWYAAVSESRTDAWPSVIYYLMGANEWRVAADWPVSEAQQTAFYLRGEGALTVHPPQQSSNPDFYIYDPHNPTPTIGGSIVSCLYPPGSVDISEVQKRKDMLTYTTEPLVHDLDVVGHLRMILYASSSARDTDFAARLSDVFPDGRAIQLQNGLLRARYRNPEGEPELLEPGRIYRFEIDLWATANRFKAGHRLRVDISSADFPRFDRNANRAGEPGNPIAARQAIYHNPEFPSHLLVQVLPSPH